MDASDLRNDLSRYIKGSILCLKTWKVTDGEKIIRRFWQPTARDHAESIRLPVSNGCRDLVSAS